MSELDFLTLCDNLVLVVEASVNCSRMNAQRQRMSLEGVMMKFELDNRQ